jgi:hypothetical protein
LGNNLLLLVVKNLFITANDLPDLSLTTNFTGVFFQYQAFSVNNINHWNVSTLTSFKMAFGEGLFSDDLNLWDVSAGTDFTGMFEQNSFF